MISTLLPGLADKVIEKTLRVTAERLAPAGAVIVSTPQDLALIDATRAIDLFRKMDVGITWVNPDDPKSGAIAPASSSAAITAPAPARLPARAPHRANRGHG